MKALCILLFASLAGWSQTPAPSASPEWPDLPDSAVAAVFGDGFSMTMGDLKNIFHALPKDAQDNLQKDPGTFLHQWGLLRLLTQLARKQKLDEQSPTRESLEFYNMSILSQAEMQDALRGVSVAPAEGQKYYDANKDKFKEVRLKAIYISFSEGGTASSSASTSGKSRTEAEAKAIAEKLVAQLRGGADFLKMVAQYSDDANSKAKDGDFTTVRGSDNIPAQIKIPIMALNQGQISDPVRQPGTIYIFRAEAVSYRPFDQVRDDILNQLRMDRYREWMDQKDREAKVDIKIPAFLPKGRPAPREPGAH